MSRIFITLDETNLNSPVPELNINGEVLKLTYRELDLLAEEIKWVQGAVSGIRYTHWKELVAKYQMVEVKKDIKL